MITHPSTHPFTQTSIPLSIQLPIHSPSTYLLNQKSVHASSHSSTHLSIYHLDISLPSFLLFFRPPPSHIHFSIHPPSLIPPIYHSSICPSIHLPSMYPPSHLAIFLPSTPSCPTHPSTYLPIHHLFTEHLQCRGAGGQPPPCSGLGFLMGQTLNGLVSDGDKCCERNKTQRWGRELPGSPRGPRNSRLSHSES